MDKFFTLVCFLLNRQFILFFNCTIQFESRWLGAGFVQRLSAVGSDCCLKPPLQASNISERLRFCDRALKSRTGLFEKLGFFGGCFASENLIAVGKSPKTLDYFQMLYRVFND